MSSGAAIGLGMAAYNLALQQQACFNQLQSLQSIGNCCSSAFGQQNFQTIGAAAHRNKFDDNFHQMEKEFNSYLSDWDSPVNLAEAR